MMERTIDGKGLILGRMATYVAQRLLRGDTITIINASEIVVSGKRSSVFEEQRAKRDTGSNIRKGPFYPRRSRDYVKRTVKRMLPTNARGEEALSRLRVFDGTPKNVTADTTVEGAEVTKLPDNRFVTVGRITKAMGGTQ